MREQDFEALAHRYAQLARTDPRGYRRRISGLTALGYGYVFGALAVLIIGNAVLAIFLTRMHALGVAGKLLVVQLGATWVALRALWVRVVPEPGIDVTREEAPALFAAIDQVRAGIHARPLHRVAITDDLNAALGQYPRLGVFGWWRNHLMLGLPLLRALAPDEARAVIAHELAHLSREHGRSSLSASRVRLTWARLHDTYVHGQTRGAWLFRRFALWYLPRMDAALQALSRAQEHEADQMAARVAGAHATARGLTRIHVVSHIADEVVWPRFIAGADHHPRPAVGWVSALAGELATARPEPATLRTLAREMDAPDDPTATHPRLGARLRAIGIGQAPPEALEPVGHDAATELLGPLGDRIQAEFDRMWMANAGASWTEKYNQSQGEMRRLAELDARAAAGPLAPEVALQRAYLVSAWRGAGEARELFAALADELPAARAALGETLLAVDDGAGIAHLDRAAADDPSLAFLAATQVTGYLERAGRMDEAAEYRRRAHAAAEEDVAARRERQRVDISIAVLPHTLPPEAIAELAAAAAADPLVRRARVVRRVVKHRPRSAAHLLVLELARWRFITLARRQKVVDTVAARIESVADCWVVHGEQAGLGRKARSVPGSLIYDRKAPPRA